MSRCELLLDGLPIGPSAGRSTKFARAALSSIADNLLANAATAITTLGELLGSDQPPAVRLSAARAVLSATLQYRGATSVPEGGAPPADAEDVESMKRRARQLVDEVVKKRDRHFKAFQMAGQAPPDPPSCINDHAAGECEQCHGWRDTAHAIVTEHGIDPEGRLTEAGSRVRERVWPLRPATIQLLNAAHGRTSERSAS
jgi:hypothetical protein